jgi:hypothetical protein
VISAGRGGIIASRLYRIGYCGAALLVFATGAAPAATSTAASPALRVTSEQPLSARGTGFDARERIRVTVRAGQRTWARETRAGARGGFTVVFRVKIDFCSTPVRIVAVGRSTGTVRARIPIRVCPN